MNRTGLIIKSSKYLFFNIKSVYVECLKVFNSTAYKMHRSWGSQSSDYDVHSLLGCSTVWSSRSSLTLGEHTVSSTWSKIKPSMNQEVSRACLAYPLILQMEAIQSSERSENFYCITWHYISEDSDLWRIKYVLSAITNKIKNDMLCPINM